MVFTYNLSDNKSLHQLNGYLSGRSYLAGKGFFASRTSSIAFCGGACNRPRRPTG